MKKMQWILLNVIGEGSQKLQLTAAVIIRGGGGDVVYRPEGRSLHVLRKERQDMSKSEDSLNEKFNWTCRIEAIHALDGVPVFVIAAVALFGLAKC